MKQIGFKNFRRFEQFPSLDLAPITIFVGENNAGKSTVVKGILALSDFLKRWREDDDVDFYISERRLKSNTHKLVKYLRNQKFYFNTSYLAHIGTFKRALYNKAEVGIITFSASLGLVDLSIDVIGDRKDEESVSGIISKVKVIYNTIGVTLLFDLQNDVANVLFAPPLPEHVEKPLIPHIKDAVLDFYKQYKKPVEFSVKISDYYFGYGPDLISSLESSVENAINVTLYNNSTDYIVGVEESFPNRPKLNISEDIIKFLQLFCESISSARPGSSRIRRRPFSLPLIPIRTLLKIEYLYAHAVTQTVIYSAKDTNDYLSRTIHEYASTPKTTNDHRRTFIVRWMKEFGIGKDFLITSVGGEAHIVKIQDENDEWVNLSDKGMGSIQLMVLLFRLAITLPKQTISDEVIKRRAMNSRSSRIIIIEEPEQNLHPMLQSKLADFLFILNQEYGYCFIIETHSEYLIRKSQVIVKENFNDVNRPLKENPFKVYYFNSSSSEEPYYEIVYQNDGNFSNDFGRGFFDEASNLAFKIL